MNCIQARTAMSAHRELTSGDFDSAEVDAHLETCAACRKALASYAQIGEKMRAVPVCTPQQDMHAKLMRALADEQMKMLQKSAPGKVPTPEFLKPYLQERAQAKQSQDEIAAFSTAETGPLPILQARRKRRPTRVNQFAVVGMAAAILMVIMMGGLTSLLMLARNNSTPIGSTSSSLNQPSEVFQQTYDTMTSYSNVVSALPTGNTIYYTAYGNGLSSRNWMLMQFDRGTQLSKPLLETPSSSPLILLSASSNWLVWLEYSRPQLIAHGSWAGDDTHRSPQRAWSLHYLSLLPQPASATTVQTPAVSKAAQVTPKGTSATPLKNAPANQPVVPTSLLLAQGIFDSTTAPGWATTPIQGTWLNGDNLLVTQIDQQGISHLESYHLNGEGKSAPGKVIASAAPGHLFAWPTANYTGLQTYWADEWTTADGVLHSNIWQQQIFEQTLRSHGKMEEHSVMTQSLFLADGMSFQPQVVDETLFLLSTSEVTVSSQGIVKPNGIPLPVRATDTTVTFTPRADPDVYAAPADASVHGTLFMIPLDGLAVDMESMLGTVGQATSLQAGSNYVIWRGSAGYQMYDVQHQSNVIVGNTLNDAKLLMVNENTTLWWSNDGASTDSAKLSMTAFNWPN